MTTMRTPIETAVRLALHKDVRSVTIYQSPQQRITATRRFRSLRVQSVDLIVTVGKPNYRQRKFIAACKKAGEPFPIKKPQLRLWPARKK